MLQTNDIPAVPRRPTKDPKLVENSIEEVSEVVVKGDEGSRAEAEQNDENNNDDKNDEVLAKPLPETNASSSTEDASLDTPIVPKRPTKPASKDPTLPQVPNRPVKSDFTSESPTATDPEKTPEAETVSEEPEPIIPTRPVRKTREEKPSTEETSLPIVPSRPAKRESPVSDDSESKRDTGNEAEAEAFSTLSALVEDSELNVEKSDVEADGDGDVTPENTDTNTTFKTFEEGGPISDTSSFNDDVETVQDKDEANIEIAEGNSTPLLESNDAFSAKSTESVADKPEMKVSEAERSLKPKAPPPKPKKLSSKIAAFQEMFSKQNIEFSKLAPESSSSSSPSIPKRPSKLSSDKIKFGNSLHGIMGRGIALPGMADPSALEKKAEENSIQDEGEVSKNANTPQLDTRKGRPKGPKGKRLPKSVTETTVETSNRFDVVIADLWEISHTKPVLSTTLKEKETEKDEAKDEIKDEERGEINEQRPKIEQSLRSDEIAEKEIHEESNGQENFTEEKIDKDDITGEEIDETKVEEKHNDLSRQEDFEDKVSNKTTGDELHIVNSKLRDEEGNSKLTESVVTNDTLAESSIHDDKKVAGPDTSHKDQKGDVEGANESTAFQLTNPLSELSESEGEPFEMVRSSSKPDAADEISKNNKEVRQHPEEPATELELLDSVEVEVEVEIEHEDEDEDEDKTPW